jgi:hypothetical protein
MAVVRGPPPLPGRANPRDGRGSAPTRTLRPEPEKTSGRASGLIAAPVSAGVSPPAAGHGDGRDGVTPRDGLAARGASAGARQRAEAARGASERVASIISAIGVIPAIGSLPKGKA